MSNQSVVHDHGYMTHMIFELIFLILYAYVYIIKLKYIINLVNNSFFYTANLLNFQNLHRKYF